jgi:fluoroquinolone transport system permease protein
MTATYKMFRYMVKQIAGDLMLAMLVIMPFIVGGLFKYGIPILEEKILAGFGYGEVLRPYYDLFSWLLAMLTGMMFAFIGGLVVLGEIDEGIAKYIIVTPPGERGYLNSRIVLPAVISGIMTAFLVMVFAINRLDLITTVVMVLSTAFCGIITAFLVVAISSNKVEGMAVGKLSGLFGITFFAPFFIKGAVRYIFVIFPMYHVGRWTQTGNMLYLITAGGLFMIWSIVLYKMFRKKFG